MKVKQVLLNKLLNGCKWEHKVLLDVCSDMSSQALLETAVLKLRTLKPDCTVDEIKDIVQILNLLMYKNYIGVGTTLIEIETKHVYTVQSIGPECYRISGADGNFKSVLFADLRTKYLVRQP